MMVKMFLVMRSESDDGAMVMIGDNGGSDEL